MDTCIIMYISFNNVYYSNDANYSNKISLFARTQSMSVKFTQHHRETSLFVSVTVMIQWAQTETTFISIQPFRMPPSSLGPDLYIATTVRTRDTF